MKTRAVARECKHSRFDSCSRRAAKQHELLASVMRIGLASIQAGTDTAHRKQIRIRPDNKPDVTCGKKQDVQ